MSTPGKFYGSSPNILLTFVLCTEDRFSVELSSFSEEAIAIFKTIPSRYYDPKTRIWNFHIKDYGKVLSHFQKLRPKFTIKELPLFVLQAVNIQKKNVNIAFDRLDPVLSSSLMPFQMEGLSFGVDKHGRCLIADDMGLGKTFQALAIANYYMSDWPLLIVTTSSMKTVWEETISSYLPSVSIMTVQYMISGKDYIGDAKILIVSYDLMTRCVDKLLERKFGVLIIDESHILKSFKAKCYMAAMQLAKLAKRVILLSGTPALSRPSELFTQLSLIDSKFFGNFFEYSKRYCDGKKTPYGWNASGKSNLQELEIILVKKFMIRRTKDEVIKALPNKVQEVITLDTNLNQFSETDRNCLIELGQKYAKKKGGEKHAALLTFFSETAKIKIPAICSYILQILENKIKFLIFAHHHIMLNAIEDLVKRKNIEYIRIDGNTKSEQRKHFISNFQFKNNYRCAILSITATNAGITLTAAQLVLFAELHWNPSIISQAEARAHRIGQEHQVVVRYLLAPGTADDSIWPMLQEKQKTLNQAGLSRDSFESVKVKKQDNVTAIKGLDINLSTSAGTADIKSYFSPAKKRKVSDEISEDAFNDGFDDILAEHSEELFNDGMDEILCDTDF